MVFLTSEFLGFCSLTVIHVCLLSTYYVPRRLCLPWLGVAGKEWGKGLGDEVIEIRGAWSCRKDLGFFLSQARVIGELGVRR